MHSAKHNFFFNVVNRVFNARQDALGGHGGAQEGTNGRNFGTEGVPQFPVLIVEEGQQLCQQLVHRGLLSEEGAQPHDVH